MTEKSKLYRFERVDEKRMSTLRNGQLFMSKPKYFNDLFDCQLRINTDANPLWGADSLLRAYDALYPEGFRVGADFPLTRRMVKQLRASMNLSGHSLGSTLRREMNADRLREEVANSVVALCFFSTAPTDSLMWAHYGDNHAGFCTQYRVVGDPEDLYEVNYSSALPEVSAMELLFSPVETMLRVLRTKSIEWAYEKEKRLLKWGNGIAPGNDVPGSHIERPEWLVPERLILGARVRRNDSDSSHRGKFEKVQELARCLGAELWQMTKSSGGLKPQRIQ